MSLVHNKTPLILLLLIIGQAEMLQMAPYLSDTAWLQLPSKKFLVFYKEQRDRFYRDSAKFKDIMGQAYPSFRYLMSDPEPSEYHDNRNKLMADHILRQMAPFTGDKMYILDCGMAHSRPGKKDGFQKTTVHILSESDRLKDRIVVMNLYCDSCIPAGNNWALDFMKGDILASFKHAANGPIVVFDLSDIPEKYSAIKEDYGALLIYATGVE